MSQEKKIKKPKLLIVEDDKFLLDLLKKGFTDQGIDIDIAIDGEDALDKISKNPPDLILLDLILPKVDGFEVLERIKKDPESSKIPVIILSNLGQKEEIERGLKLGAEDYLVKASFPLEQIVAKVKKTFNNTN